MLIKVLRVDKMLLQSFTSNRGSWRLTKLILNRPFYANIVHNILISHQILVRVKLQMCCHWNAKVTNLTDLSQVESVETVILTSFPPPLPISNMCGDCQARFCHSSHVKGVIALTNVLQWLHHKRVCFHFEILTRFICYSRGTLLWNCLVIQPWIDKYHFLCLV